jgi:hypothetical protein
LDTQRGCIRKDIPVMTTNFGFSPGILDYWMLVADWRSGSFAILLAVGVLLVGYALATRNQMPASEGPMFREGPDPSAPVQTAVPLDRITE